MKRLFSSLIFLLTFCSLLTAQSQKVYIMEDVERSAGYFHHYETLEDATAATHPKGYKAFYISHFGRHGCRWNTNGQIYTETLARLEKAHQMQLLTPLGEHFLDHARVLAEDAEGRLGELTPRGVQEHKGIAKRMYGHYPEVFGPGAKIYSRSTPVVRCVLSMSAFNESLKEEEPRLEMIRESSPKGCAAFGGHLKNSYSKESWETELGLRKERLDEHRFMTSIFTDGGAWMAEELSYPEEFMYQCFEMASFAQDTDYLGIDLYSFFTPEEIWEMWKCINANAYLNMGCSYKFGDVKIENAKPLLRNIIDCAEKAISGESGFAADLRFGHDSNIIPLLALIGIEEAAARVPVEVAHEHWNVTKVSPMATNLQLIFFRNAAGNVKVRVLFREGDAKLPLEGGPFYDWKDLKAYFESCLLRSPYYEEVDVDEFLTRTRANAIVMIDVRTPEEHAAGFIPGTDWNFNVKSPDFVEQVQKVVPAGSQVAVYCRSGRRSKAAVKLLNDNGFKVLELATGYNGWAARQ